MIVSNVPSLGFVFCLSKDTCLSFTPNEDEMILRIHRDAVTLKDVSDGFDPTVMEFLQRIGYTSDEDYDGNDVSFYDMFVFKDGDVSPGMSRKLFDDNGEPYYILKLS